MHRKSCSDARGTPPLPLAANKCEGQQYHVMQSPAALNHVQSIEMCVCVRFCPQSKMEGKPSGNSNSSSQSNYVLTRLSTFPLENCIKLVS